MKKEDFLEILLAIVEIFTIGGMVAMYLFYRYMLLIGG